jgi:hypothetical protein
MVKGPSSPLTPYKISANQLLCIVTATTSCYDPQASSGGLVWVYPADWIERAGLK